MIDHRRGRSKHLRRPMTRSSGSANLPMSAPRAFDDQRRPTEATLSEETSAVTTHRLTTESECA